MKIKLISRSNEAFGGCTELQWGVLLGDCRLPCVTTTSQTFALNIYGLPEHGLLEPTAQTRDHSGFPSVTWIPRPLT